VKLKAKSSQLLQPPVQQLGMLLVTEGCRQLLCSDPVVPAHPAYCCLLSGQPPNTGSQQRAWGMSAASSLPTAVVTAPIRAESLPRGAFPRLSFKIPFHPLRTEPWRGSGCSSCPVPPTQEAQMNDEELGTMAK